MSLTNREIYNTSLSLIGESAASLNVEDYEERAPYLIASFCCANASLDKRIRKCDSLGTAKHFSPVYLGLDAEFPLCEPLTSAASIFCAAMLVIDDDSSLSDSLYDKYCDLISTLSMTYSVEDQQGECSSIVEKYFFD